MLASKIHTWGMMGPVMLARSYHLGKPAVVKHYSFWILFVSLCSERGQRKVLTYPVLS